MLGFIISTIIFFAASFLLHRYLDDWGLDSGKARTVLVLAIASVISYGSMALINHFTGAPDMVEAAVKLASPVK
jgi:hypothetical protein